jgi:transposase
MGTEYGNPIFNILKSSAAWAGLIPDNYESVGKHLSGKTRKDNQTLCLNLMQSANVSSRSRTYLAVQYRRI